MIKKLKIKFILLSMSSLFVLLVLLVSGMNFVNYSSVCKEADETLSLIALNNGVFPDVGRLRDRMWRNMSPELPYETRYFSLLLDDEGGVIHAEMSSIISVDVVTAAKYAIRVINSGKTCGFIGDFRFVKSFEGDRVRISFLDCGRKLALVRDFLIISAVIALIGFIIVFFVMFFCSGRIIRPIAESYEKQKRFITDAGHEIKTPLTVIGANADILEMDIGKNECIDDIRREAKRLTELTNDLVYLARMEEAGNLIQMIDFPVSETVCEEAMSFKALAQAQKKEFKCDVEPMLSMRGNSKAIAQLVSILMDNAMKYSPEGAGVSISLSKKGKTLVLTVLNTTKDTVNAENLKHVFDRFYRTDSSRNSETGGHGIGLSLASAITAAHGGRIRATAPDEHSFCVTVSLPI